MHEPSAPIAAFNAAAEALWARLSPAWPGLDVEVVARTDSTNTRLLERARQGLAGPGVLVALEQTAGRGRLGRGWRASAGSSLTLSLALPWPPQQQPQSPAGGTPPAADPSGLSIAIGVAAAEALHEAVKLKWPNDLCVTTAGGLAKLGGILIETVSSGARIKAVVIGLGINVGEAAALPLADAAPSPQALGAAPTAVATALPPAALASLRPGATPAQVFEEVVPALLDAAASFAAQGMAPFTRRFARRDALAGQMVQVLQAGGPPGAGRVLTEGRAAGLDAHGRLLVHTAAGLEAVCSGEVSIRPVSGGNAGPASGA